MSGPFFGEELGEGDWLVAALNPETNMTFLVVDDQFNVRRMVVNFLRSFGYTKFVDASDGAKAWDKLQAHPVDFIICDWNMPRVPGIEFLRRVRNHEKYRSLPFLMVTAEMAGDMVAEAAEWQVDEYVLKPFKADTLKAKIDLVLERRSNPSELDQALMGGSAHLRQGRVEEALKLYEYALTLNPNSARTHAALGEALEMAGQQDQAIGHYQESVGISKRFLRGHDNLARVFKTRGDTEKAEEHSRQATEISPRNSKRQLALGKLLLEKGDNKAALKAMRMAQEHAGQDAEVMTEVGEALLNAGLNTEAAEAFSGARDIDPGQVHIYNRLGIALRRQKKFDQAVVQYQQALEVAPEDENLHYNLAVALAESGKRKPARKALSDALRLKSDFAEARALLQRLA